MSGKMYLKDKLEDEELDLSMMQLTEIPVKEIEQLGTKVLKLNLAHNLLTSVPGNLPLLTHLTSIDLSKNQIIELPENFGQLTKLKSLDLYSNQISKLPVSFAQLKSLKFLDLKENPLVPELAKAAGPCITRNDCELAAKKVVARLQSIESQLFQEKKQRLEQEAKMRMKREKKEEMERERLRQEKKMLKEKRREEAKMKEQEQKDPYAEYMVRAEHNGHNTAANHHHQNGHSAHDIEETEYTGFSCMGLLLRMILYSMVGVVALGVSLLWLYTDGKMDADSIQSAVPVIQKDVESTLLRVSDLSYKYYQAAELQYGPYINSTGEKLSVLYATAKTNTLQGYEWLNANYGDTVRAGLAKTKDLLKVVRLQCEEAGKNLIPFLDRVWTQARPYFQTLGKIVLDRSIEVWTYLQQQFPVYIDWLTESGTLLLESIQNSIQKIVQALS
jgi:hypothetical protein